MSKPLTVAINIGIEGWAQRCMVRGIVRYCRSHTLWKFIEYKGMPLARSPHLECFDYDGLITPLNTPIEIRSARAKRVPVVAISRGLPISGVSYHSVISNDALIGEMGARHFLDKGFRNFAYYGASHYRWALMRRDGFCRTVKKAGFSVAIAETPHARVFDKAMPCLRRWLTELPRPLAVMASDDLPGRHILAACQEMGLQVPEQVAVLGVDDDDVLCEMAAPPMSSVVQDCDRIGYEAAALLDRIMRGERLPPQTIEIPPLRIVTRRSTDVTAIEDADVAKVLRLIHSKTSEPLSVKALLRNVPMSRRTLERRFAAALGRSPADEIRRCRLDRAMLLLRTSTLKIDLVAIKSGFGDARGMAAAFRHGLKTSASAYRRQFQDH